MEILNLLAKGLSNRVIAERLFLAVDTIKGHNRNIFNKLEVQSRTDAVIRACELGLLSASLFLNIFPQYPISTPLTNTKVSVRQHHVGDIILVH